MTIYETAYWAYGYFVPWFWVGVGAQLGCIASIKAVMESKNGVVVMSLGPYGLLLPLISAGFGMVCNGIAAEILVLLNANFYVRIPLMYCFATYLFSFVKGRVIDILGGKDPKNGDPKKNFEKKEDAKK